MFPYGNIIIPYISLHLGAPGEGGRDAAALKLQRCPRPGTHTCTRVHTHTFQGLPPFLASCSLGGLKLRVQTLAISPEYR